MMISNRKEGISSMKNHIKGNGFKKAVAAVAKMATSVNVNSTCAFVVHQPKLPGNAKKLRKF